MVPSCQTLYSTLFCSFIANLITEEPDAGKLLVRICGGAVRQRAALPGKPLIYKILKLKVNKKIIKTVNIFKTYEEHGEPKDSIEKNVGEKLEKLGFKIDFVNKAPLDLFAKENLLMVSEIELNKRRMIKRAADLKDFIKIVNKPAILITEKTKEQEVLGIPLIESRNLEDLDSKELLKIAKKTVS